MPLITASKIHNGHHWLPEGTVIEITDDGVVTALHDGSAAGNATVYEGIVCPCFINAHCHLELSHMKGLIPEHTELIPFLKNIPLHRNDFTDEQKKTARHAGYRELVNNGVIAVGDISNVSDTMDIRALDDLHMHTFVECLGFAEQPQRQFQQSVGVYEAFAAQHTKTKILRQSIVPHAPYTVSSALFRMIDKYQPQSLISIHNQESNDEDEYYLIKGGRVPELLQLFNINDSFFQPSGKSSLQTYLEWLSPSHPFIFVHNTRTKLADLEVANSLLQTPYWCLCPNANLYIENRLPDVPMFIKEKANICIGTDSLASNHQLSILAELITLKKHFVGISWEMLLKWSTYNGACALQMENIVGSLSVGLAPGLLQITGLDSGTPVVNRII